MLKGIRTAINTGFKRIKINAVILKNRNHDEVIDLVQFALDYKIDISFIEEMPLGLIGSHQRTETYYSSDQNEVKGSHFVTQIDISRLFAKLNDASPAIYVISIL